MPYEPPEAALNDRRDPSLAFRLIVGAAALVIWRSRFDYGWGYGDQEDFYPYLLHLLDDGLLSNDWFVNTQVGGVGVRTYFVLLLRAVCVAVPPQVAVGLLFVVSWIGIADGIQRVTVGSGGDRVAAVLAVVVALCLTPKWTLGGNDLVYTMLVPEMVAWALAIYSLHLFATERYLLCGVILGIAAWFQLLVGIQVAGLMSLILLVRLRSAEGLRMAAIVGASAAVTALPILVPVGMQQFATVPPATAELALASLTQVRAPHHYIPSSFPVVSWARMGLLVVLGLWGLRMERRHSAQFEPMPVGAFLVVTGTMCFLSWVFTELVPIGVVIKLQLFKLTVMVKLIAIIALAKGLSLWMREHVGWAPPTLERVVLSAILVGSVVAGLLLAYRGDALQAIPYGDPALEAWAAEDTSRDAVFALPPSNSSFRSHARRAVVVNYAAFPFGPLEAAKWYERMADLVGTDTIRGGPGLALRLDSLYDARPASEWRGFAHDYGVDYLVRRASATETMPFEMVYRDTAWVVYSTGTRASDAGRSTGPTVIPRR